MNSTDICNMALAYIGQGRIASIEEESEEAIQCGIFYDHLRRKLLSEHRWGFAERYVKLALLNEKSPDGSTSMPTRQNALSSEKSTKKKVQEK